MFSVLQECEEFFHGGPQLASRQLILGARKLGFVSRTVSALHLRQIEFNTPRASPKMRPFLQRLEHRWSRRIKYEILSSFSLSFCFSNPPLIPGHPSLL